MLAALAAGNLPVVLDTIAAELPLHVWQAVAGAVLPVALKPGQESADYASLASRLPASQWVISQCVSGVSAQEVAGALLALRLHRIPKVSRHTLLAVKAL